MSPAAAWAWTWSRPTSIGWAGKLEINSTPGQGSQFRIKLPLTLTIIPALIVSAEGERFAIPQINVEELLRVRPEETKSRIEVVGGTEVLLLRDRILPLLRLDEFLGVLPTYAAAGEGRELDRRAHWPTGVRRVITEDERAGNQRRRAAAGAGDSAPQSDGRRGNLRGALEIAVITTGMIPVRRWWCRPSTTPKRSWSSRWDIT